MSYDRTRRRHDVLQKTSDLWRLEDVRFTTSWRRLVYAVLKISYFQRLEEAWFTTFWKRPIYNFLKTSDLRRLKDVGFTTSWRHLINDFLRRLDLWRLLLLLLLLLFLLHWQSYKRFLQNIFITIAILINNTLIKANGTKSNFK